MPLSSFNRESNEMTKSSLKDLVATIQKAAARPFPAGWITPRPLPTGWITPDVKTPQTVSDPAKGTGTTIGHTSLGVSLPEVQKMQEDIQALATQIKSHKIPVNLPSNLVESVEQTLATPQFADGAWGPITDKALHHVLNLAKSLVLLLEKFGLKNEIYVASNLEHFADNLEYQVIGHHINLSAEEQVRRAENLTKHLVAITQLYLFLIEKIPTISNEHILAPHEKQTFQSGMIEVNYQNKPFSLPLASLSGPAQYKAWLDSNHLTDPSAAMAILDQLIKNSTWQAGQ
jgi:hypothetical protein